MRLYDNAYPSTYEEIKTWYPAWYRDVLEMDALWRVWGGQLDEIQAGIIRAIDNNFIDYADAETLAKLETFFHITYDGPRTLTERRNMIKAIILGQGHVGQKEIKELIAVFTNGKIDVELIGGMVRITVTRDFGDNFNLYDCHFILDNRIPAHLALDMVDKLLPVSVFNENGFIFRDLKIALAVKNRSLIVDGIKLDGERVLDGTWELDSIRPGIPFIDLRVGISLPKNNMTYTPQALALSAYGLKNKNELSAGAQIALSAGNQFAFRPIDFGANILFRNHGTQVQGIRLTGAHKLDGSWNLDAAEVEIFGGLTPQKLDITGLAIQNSFKATARMQFEASAGNKENYRQESTRIAGLKASQTFGLSGSVIMDGRWTLNGDFILKGSRSLNPIFIKEDL